MSDDEKPRLLHFPRKKTNVRETLQEVLAASDELEAVIVLGITKNDCYQLLRTSSMTHMELCFLSHFLDAYALKWFDVVEDEYE